ncbi:MAG: ferredoxin III, nif-specific [Geminicoccaceae bacterium]|nr:MAG: ferredoxin III, nif-specific [Geminicoccaceae bacterium]
MPHPAFTRDGTPYEPIYLVAIDPKNCLGCGRCHKVCGRGVMALKGVDEDGAFVDLDEDDDPEDVERMVMVLAQPGACIGCGACARVCTKGCQTHEPG